MFGLRKRGYLEEAAKIKDFDATLTRMKKMTNDNDHGEALLTGARLLGAKSIADRVALVNKLHDLEGSLPSTLNQYRYGLMQDLMLFAKKKLSSEDFNKFSSGF